MKLVVFLITIVLGMNSCEGQQVCMKGTRITAGGNVKTNNDTQGTICQDGDRCILSTINYTLAGVLTKLEYSDCFNTFLDKESCTTLARGFGISAETTCLKNVCKTFACNHFSAADGCSAEAPAGDIQILPNCTLKGIMHQIYECSKPIMAGYPYPDMTTCKGKLNSAYQCSRDVMMTCLNGNCATILDALPYPLQLFYSQMKIQYLSHQSYSSLLASVYPNNATLDQALHSTCLVVGDSYTKQLMSLSFDQLLEMMHMDTASLKVLLKNPVCDSTALVQFFRKVFPELIELYGEKNHKEFCRTMKNLWNDVSAMWENHCNKTAVLSMIKPLIPSAYSPLYPQIVKAMNILEQGLFDDVEIPGCENVFATTTTPSASDAEAAPSDTTTLTTETDAASAKTVPSAIDAAAAPSDTTIRTVETTSGVASTSIWSALNFLSLSVIIKILL